MSEQDFAVELEPRGVHVSGEYGRSETINREEAYLTARFTFRGKERTATIVADRYEHSSGWSEWRVNIPHGIDPADGIGVKGYAAVRAVVRTVAEEWLQGDEYPNARRLAFAKWISRTIKDERYSVDSVLRMIAQNAHELTIDDHERLIEATRCLSRMLELVEA
jgi:hypothetical protein